jgi:hypothetical protein
LSSSSSCRFCATLIIGWIDRRLGRAVLDDED